MPRQLTTCLRLRLGLARLERLCRRLCDNGLQLDLNGGSVHEPSRVVEEADIVESRELLLLLSTGMGDKWPGSDRASHVITLPIVLHEFLLIYVLLTPLQVSSSRPSNPMKA